MQDDNLRELDAALNRDITDDEGQMTGEEETPHEEPSDSEPKTTDEESARAEKSVDESESDAQSDDDDDENQLAEDDSGQQYIPKKRFDKIYAKQKEYERALADIRKEREQGEALLRQMQGQGQPKQEQQLPGGQPRWGKADVLELKMELPQFDPRKADYDPALDKLGFEILRAHPNLSPLDAGKRAIEMAKEFGKREADARVAARTVKSVQSDQGITGRRTSGGEAATPNPDEMTLEEKERYLRETGNW